MKKVIFTIGMLISFLIVVIIVVLDKPSSFKDYNNDTIYYDFSKNEQYETPWVRDSFKDYIKQDYVQYDISEIPSIEDIVEGAPQWIKNNYAFYPEDTRDTLICYWVCSNILHTDNFSKSDMKPYYTYSDAYSVNFDIDGKVYTFTFTENYVYMYIEER